MTTTFRGVGDGYYRSIEETGFPFHLLPFRNFFVQHTMPVSYDRDTKSRWSILADVSARGSKISGKTGNTNVVDSNSL